MIPESVIFGIGFAWGIGVAFGIWLKKTAAEEIERPYNRENEGRFLL